MSGACALSLVLYTVSVPVSRCAQFKDQLGLDGEANSEIDDGYATGSSARRGVGAVRHTRSSNPGNPRRFGYLLDARKRVSSV